MFQKIAFIHYCTQNLERALKFYNDVLELKLLVQNEEWVEFEVGDQRLALRQVDSMPARPKDSHPNGAMIWLEARPIEQAIAHLKINKVNFINELEVNPYGKTIIFEDLDCNLIGLYEPPEKNN